MAKKLNRNQALRDKILKGCFTEHGYIGGINRYENCPQATMESLIAEHFVDLDENQNDSPTIRELVDFGASNISPNHGVAYTGYVVDKSRSDYRVSIDGINGYVENTPRNAKIVKKWARTADERFIEESESGISFEFWWD